MRFLLWEHLGTPGIPFALSAAAGGAVFFCFSDHLREIFYGMDALEALGTMGTVGTPPYLGGTAWEHFGRSHGGGTVKNAVKLHRKFPPLLVQGMAVTVEHHPGVLVAAVCLDCFHVAGDQELQGNAQMPHSIGDDHRQGRVLAELFELLANLILLKGSAHVLGNDDIEIRIVPSMHHLEGALALLLIFQRRRQLRADKDRPQRGRCPVLVLHAAKRQDRPAVSVGGKREINLILFAFVHPRPVQTLKLLTEGDRGCAVLMERHAIPLEAQQLPNPRRAGGGEKQPEPEAMMLTGIQRRAVLLRGSDRALIRLVFRTPGQSNHGLFIAGNIPPTLCLIKGGTQHRVNLFNHALAHGFVGIIN